MKTHLFIVEGSHDVAFIGRILKTYLDLKKVEKVSQLSTFGGNIIPKSFPFLDNSDSLDIFNIVPTFFGNNDVEICCVSAGGQESLLSTLDTTLAGKKRNELVGLESVTIFADADTYNRTEKINYFKGIAKDKEFTIISEESFVDENIIIKTSRLDFKVPFFIFPNNKDQGSIEDTIIENIHVKNTNDKHLLEEYTKLVDSAKNWCDANGERKNSKREKAIIGGLGNIYAQGYSNVVIIDSEKFKWLDKTNAVGGIPELVDFIKKIIT